MMLMEVVGCCYCMVCSFHLLPAIRMGRTRPLLPLVALAPGFCPKQCEPLRHCYHIPPFVLAGSDSDNEWVGDSGQRASAQRGSRPPRVPGPVGPSVGVGLGPAATTSPPRRRRNPPFPIIQMASPDRLFLHAYVAILSRSM